MKKSLLAIALVASFGAVQAQTTVSGIVRYDLSNTSSVMSSGITKSEINLTNVEKLDGGLTLTAKLGLNGAARNGSFDGTDASMQVAGGFGSVLVGQIRTVNSITARGFGGAPVMGADGFGPVLAADTNSDIVKYATPAFGGFSGSVSSTRAIGTTGSRTSAFGLAGKVGAVDTAVDYNQDSGRVRASAATQVMGLTVGAGYSGNQLNVADSYVVGLSKQLGAFTFGGAYTNGNGSAKEAGVSYALSSRTEVRVAYQDLTTGPNTTQVRLGHSF